MEMLVNRDILAISIPFSAGVILAAYLPQGELSLYIAASAACLALLICLSVLLGKDAGRFCVSLAFLFSGCLLAWNSRIGIGLEGKNLKVAELALQKLISFIDNIGFRNEESPALIKALICGDKSGLEKDVISAFRASGASHILALSGLHMGIIYGVLSKLLFIFGNSVAAKTTRSLLIIIVCAFFSLMTGASASVVRAFLFIVLNEAAALLPGRQKSSLGVFCSALMLQLCISPLSAKSAGFQLSYAAMLGIYLIFPVLKSWLPESAGKFACGIWKSCALSIACQTFTAPLAYIYFGSLPGMFLITNLLSLPLTEAFIILSIISLGLSALGICPEIIKDLTEFTAQTLIYCIETIASLTS